MAFSIIIVPKKTDHSTHQVTYKMVVDSRKINEQLKFWSYSLMRIDSIFSRLHAKLFLTLHVRSSYYNIIVAEDSRKYISFSKEYGRYEFLHVSFGIFGAPSYFDMIINETLKG